MNPILHFYFYCDYAYVSKQNQPDKIKVVCLQYCHRYCSSCEGKILTDPTGDTMEITYFIHDYAFAR